MNKAVKIFRIRKLHRIIQTMEVHIEIIIWACSSWKSFVTPTIWNARVIFN